MRSQICSITALWMTIGLLGGLNKIYCQEVRCALPSCVNGQPRMIYGGCICVCDEGFMGHNCDQEDGCAAENPCLHGGKCFAREDGSLYCDCPLGYLSPNCEDRDPCVTNAHHCLNGGTCQRLDDIDFTCACALPYEGNHCERQNLCRLDVGECLDTGTILDDVEPLCYPCAEYVQDTKGCELQESGDYTCICLPGYSGDKCETRDGSAFHSRPVIIEDLNLTSLTLPVMSLDEILPHDFLVHVVASHKDAVVYLVLRTSPHFRIHVSVQLTTWPNCEVIVEQWNTFVPTEKGDSHIEIRPPLYRGHRAEYMEGGDQNETADRDSDGPLYHIILWPEISVFSPEEPPEITVELGFFELQCTTDFVDTIPQTTSNASEDDAAIHGRDSCLLAKELHNEAMEFTCECFRRFDVREFVSILQPLYFRTQVYLPVAAFEQIVPSCVILWFVVAICIIYILLLLFFCWVDRRNSRATRLVVMTDIQEIERRHFYLITVETGFHLLARPSFNVSCAFYGSRGRTQPIVLSDKSLGPILRMDDEANYLISNPQDLGEIQSVRIWHDDAGDNPKWYLKKVVMKNIKSNQVWYFCVDSWLGYTRSSMICTVNAATPEWVESYRLGRFGCTLKYEMRDRHVYLAPFLASPISLWRRSEALTVLCLILLIHMILLLSFHGFPHPNEIKYLVTWRDPWFFSSHVILWGFLASLAGLLVAILLSFCFRHAREWKVPTLLVCRLKGPPKRPPPPKRVFKEALKMLDPQREMIGMDVKPISEVKEVKLEIKNVEFRIPSTSVSHTEFWIAEHIVQPSEQVDPIQALPLPPKREPYKRILNDGIMGAVTSIKDDDDLRLVYQPEETEDIDELIAKDIRTSFNRPLWEIQESFEQIPPHIEVPKPVMTHASAQTLSTFPTPERVKEEAEEEQKPLEKERYRMCVELCLMKSSESHRFPLCSWCLILLWLFCILIMIVCALVVIIFGCRYGWTLTWEWIFSFCWASFFTFLFLCLFLFLLALIIHCRRRSKKMLGEEERRDRRRFQLKWQHEVCDCDCKPLPIPGVKHTPSSSELPNTPKKEKA